MPHVVLKTPVQLEEIQQAFQPIQADENGVYIKLIEMFKSNDGNKLFVEAYVNEKPLSQRIGLLIREQAPNEFIILLHEVGFPRSTFGLHFAIAQLANWILNLHSDGVVKKSNLQIPLVQFGRNT